MFYNCSKLSSIILPYAKSNNKIENMNYMFAYCSSLTSVNLLSIGTKNIKFMEGIFSSCSSLEIFNIPGINNQFESINEFGLQKYNI